MLESGVSARVLSCSLPLFYANVVLRGLYTLRKVPFEYSLKTSRKTTESMK